MTRRPVVWFHIGAPKTGTTFLQSLMWRERMRLRADGLLYPGWDRDAHFAACLDLRRIRFLGHRPAGSTDAWATLVEEIRDWDGDAIIDHELYSGAWDAPIRRAMRDLSFADVHVLYTARDVARQLPATWQERMKNRDTTTWAQFLERVRVRDPDQRTFWRLHDVPEILARWARHVGPERMHVITLPASGRDPDALWRRFATTLGLDPDDYDTTRSTPNESIGAAEATLLRRFNTALGDGNIWFPAYSFVVKQRLAPLLARRDSARIGLPKPVHDWTVQWARTEIDAIRDAGYDVIGDLDDLIPAPFVPGADPDEVTVNPWALRALRVAAASLRGLSRFTRPSTIPRDDPTD